MGGGSWNSDSERSYRVYSSSVSHTTNHREVFHSRHLNESLDPIKIVIRESCDSEQNPTSNAIIIGLDVTGSMGSIAHHITKEGLGNLMNGIMSREPVVNPHIMFMGIGDAYSDNAPLQVSQFEPDIRIVEQLQDLYIEGNGGGNQTESYDLPWYFAAYKTKIDCFEKRGDKGYLFTMGDENPPEVLKQHDLAKIFGPCEQGDVLSEDSLRQAQKTYNVFHLIIEEGSYCKRHGAQSVGGRWTQLLGKRALMVNDYRHVSEIILSAIDVNEGKNVEDVIASWQTEEIRSAVRHALGA